MVRTVCWSGRTPTLRPQECMALETSSSRCINQELPFVRQSFQQDIFWYGTRRPGPGRPPRWVQKLLEDPITMGEDTVSPETELESDDEQHGSENDLSDESDSEPPHCKKWGVRCTLNSLHTIGVQAVMCAMHTYISSKCAMHTNNASVQAVVCAMHTYKFIQVCFARRPDITKHIHVARQLIEHAHKKVQFQLLLSSKYMYSV